MQMAKRKSEPKWRERDLEAIERRLRAVGLEFKYVSSDDDFDDVFRRCVVCDVRTKLTFDLLERISKALGTRSIDIGCDVGFVSVRTHDRYLVICKIQREGRLPGALR